VTKSKFDAVAIEEPRVRVLLATYNGARWLDEQIGSIAKQQGVQISIVASDDSSSDGTLDVLSRWATHVPVEVLPPVPERFGSAHRNFLRLIRDTDLGDADYFALSDQDDIWLPEKLLRGIECLRSFNAHGYSSNVTAFWPDGSRHDIDKAQPLQPLDHLFSSPGPGCTFVMPRSVFSELKTFVADNFERLQTIWVHDWLIYAFVRARGGRWHIDSRSNMLYRQHDRNEIGVNSGWRAALSRLRLVRSGAFRRDVLAIADCVGERSAAVEAVRRLRLVDRLDLLRQVRQFRRRLSECVVLAVLILVMPRG
jgi:rhamnosyltransferase